MVYIVIYQFQNGHDSGVLVLGAYDTKEKAIERIATTKADIKYNNSFDGTFDYENEIDTPVDYCAYKQDNSDYERVYLVTKEIK